MESYNQYQLEGSFSKIISIQAKHAVLNKLVCYQTLFQHEKKVAEFS